MKTRKPVAAFLLVAAILAEGLGRVVAETTNTIALESLVRQYLPGCQFRLDGAGKPEALIAPTGEVLDLTAAARENPEPKEALGYWYSPTMEFLSRQKIKAATPQEAAGVIKLLHALWRGSDFVKQKIYNARRFDGGWVIEVDHDFTHYPGMIRAIHPYELLLDADQRGVQIRERCYWYRGSASVYSNTVHSVYERELKLNRGLNYPEVLEKELSKALENEKAQMTIKPGQAQRKE